MNRLPDIAALACGATILAMAGTAIAQATTAAEEIAIDTVVVTGTRLHDGLSGLPTAHTVLDRADMEAANAASVLDLLQRVPGIQVTQPGGRGGVASVFIRGGEANFTMVLIDGIRVNDPNNTRGGSFDFSILDAGDIERIEIVRGPQSAIYGSDALGGVVNVITRAGASEPEAVLQGEIGEDGYGHAGLALAGRVTARGGFFLRAATLDDGDTTPGNAFSSDSIAGKLSFASGEAWRVHLFARYSDSEGTSFPEDSGGPRLAVLPGLDSKSSEDFNAGVTGAVRLAPSWTLDFNAARYDRSDEYASPGVAPGVRDAVPPNGANSRLERTSLSAWVTGETRFGLSASFGADLNDEEGTSDGFIEIAPGFELPGAYALARRVTGAFAEFRYRPGDALALLVGLRRDDPDESAGETTRKLGAEWQVDPATTVRANWGEGFKLPSFFALGSPLVGNPDLRSEKSESADVGVTRHLGDALSTTFSIYRTRFSDLIDFDFDLFTNVNRRSVAARGAELEASWSAAPGLDFTAEVTYLDLDVKDSDVPLRQRPDWRGSLSVEWTPREDWLVHAAWTFVGETFDSSVPTGGLWLDGHQRLDASLRWQATQDLELLLSVDNVLDADYEQAIGFPAPGRRGRIGFRYRL